MSTVLLLLVGAGLFGGSAFLLRDINTELSAALLLGCLLAAAGALTFAGVLMAPSLPAATAPEWGKPERARWPLGVRVVMVVVVALVMIFGCVNGAVMALIEVTGRGEPLGATTANEMDYTQVRPQKSEPRSAYLCGGVVAHEDLNDADASSDAGRPRAVPLGH